MYFHRMRGVLLFCSFIAISGLFLDAIAKIDANFLAESRAQIDQIRKRDCNVTVNTGGGSAEGISISVEQIRHHFGFGASIAYSFLVDEPKYAETFLKFFEWATPENDLKWPSTDPTSEGPDYTKPDSLLRFCQENDIKYRAHNLFWNEKAEWLPEWTLSLNQSDFKQAVDDRVSNAMNHYKGKVEHWDVINEIIHGSELADRTGDPNIYIEVFNDAHAIDPNAKLTVNDYNVLIWSDTENYINNVKDMMNSGAHIDIIGCEGHFGDKLDKNDYTSKLSQVASLNKPIWITELDFNVSDRENKFEEFMRAMFGNSNVEGVIMWVWWEGNKWRENLNSTVAELNFSTSSLGTRYLQLMDEWTTSESGTTDNSGKYSFRGFHGKYVVTASNGSNTAVDTFYLDPGNGTTQWSIDLQITDITDTKVMGFTEKAVRINGQTVAFRCRTEEKGPIFVSAYTVTGKLLSKKSIDMDNGVAMYSELPAGCQVYRIETEKEIYKTIVGFSLR